MARNADPQDFLEPNTKVNVINTGKGVLIETIPSKDQFGRYISVFKVKITEKYISRSWKAIKPYIINVNYAFVQIIESN